MYEDFLKRIFDFIVAIFALSLLSPLFILVTISLLFANSGKPFYFQQRPGKYGKLFKIIKFRTMRDHRDSKGNLLPDSKRITKFGSFIRKSSLDELPQLLNVIKGDMSLIGPRPLLPQYLSLYSSFQQRRNEVRPGITGWAQVHGRNVLSWEHKFRYDVWYVDRISFMLDLYILFLTVKKVVVFEGIAEEGHVTATEFKGNF